MRNWTLASAFSLALPFFLTSCTGATKPVEDDSAAVTDSDADTDTDTDTDTDADTDADSDADSAARALTTYEDFTAVQGEVFCTMLEACGMLDDFRFADYAACVASITERLTSAECPEYSEIQATKCIRAEIEGTADCSTVTSSPFPACKSVCGTPPAAEPPAASSAAPRKK